MEVEMEMKMNRTYEQQITFNVVSRVAALVSLCCASKMIIIISREKLYRSRIYHRIMLGCGINVIILAGTFLWGTAALPADKSESLGAVGNTATCSASGFLFHYAMFVTPSYYFALSVLSFAAVQYNFDFSKVAWIEKWIHIVVYIFPISSASYLLFIEAFNPVANGCSLASYPVGCGDQCPTGKIKCERGPQNIGQLQLFLVGMPVVAGFLLSVLMMLLVYLHVRKGGEKELVWSVTKQSAIYIFTLVLIYSFRFLDAILIFAMGDFNYYVNLLANTNEALIGMYFFIAYQCLRSKDKPSEGEIDVEKQKKKKKSSGSIADQKPKHRFSIFDGSNIPEESPWAEFLTEGEDTEYELGTIWRQ